MKINSINSQIHQIKKYQNTAGVRKTNSNTIPMRGYSQISFGKANANKDQAIFIGAESNPWTQAGGVGVVMQDYRSFGPPGNQVEVIPYYKAKQDENDNVIPVKDEEGKYVMLDKDNKPIKVKLVKEKTMQWGKIENNDIKLFKRIQAPDENQTDTFFVFVDDVAIMEKPYGGGMQYRSGAQQVNNGWYGDPYAKYSKATVEFLPEIIEEANKGREEKGLPEFNPATLVCSDSQTGYVHEYLAQHAVKDKDKPESCYYGIHPTYVGHNLGPGYCGETSARNMFVNLGATPEQIAKIEADPMFQDVKDTNKENNYFAPFIADAIDETGSPSAIMVPIHYTKKATANGEGFSKAFTVVSEDYAKSMATNPQATQAIYNHVKQMKLEGTFDGILNPLNNKALDPSKDLPNERFNEDCPDEIDGKEVVFKKFKHYQENPTYEQMREVKNENKLLLLERLSAEDTTIITGNPKRTADINSEAPRSKSYNVIKPELLQMIKDGRGDEVPVFVSWGRADMQKGHDVVVRAFEKFAKTEEGKNAILILGAGLVENDKESANLTKLFKRILREKVKPEKTKPEEAKNPEAKPEEAKQEGTEPKDTKKDEASKFDLQGRIVHIDGWAPAYALSSAADFAVFGSRFEPCGLTDLEAMKYYCTPIVANTQGFKQKNFDPRNENEKDIATSYKTQHEFNLLKEQVNHIINGYVNNDAKEKELAQKEFPIFRKADGNYDDSLFKKFAEEYKKETKREKDKDWDKLSLKHEFKYYGCARTLKDGILEAELTDAMFAAVRADKATKEKIFENIKKTDTSWDGNEKLHPADENNVRKSSLQRYKELHMNKEYSVPTEADLLKITDDNFIDENMTNRQQSDIKNRIDKYLSGSLVGGALVALLTRLKSSKEDGMEVLKQELNDAKDKISELQADFDSQLAEAAKNATKKATRNMVIVGIAAAGVGAAATYFASKYINKKKAEKQPQVQPQPQPVQPQVTQQQAVQPQVTVEAPKPVATPKPSSNTNLLQNFVSMDDFAKGLNKA